MYVPYALAWGVGTPGLAALADPRVAGLVPDVGVAVGVLTLMVDLLLMRAIDDIRDRAYDQEFNPGRPLASGAVSVRDLTVLVVAGSALILALNAWRWPVMCVLAGQLGYAFMVLWADRRLGWPSGDALVLGLLVNVPVQFLINVFLYAGYLYSAGLGPTWQGVADLAVAVLAFLHLEFARKTTREPRRGERTYVSLFGPSGTALLAVACAVLSVVLLFAMVRPWTATAPGAWAAWLVAAPLGFVARGAVRFWRHRESRWPYGLAALFLLVSFVVYQCVNLIEWTVAS